MYGRYGADALYYGLLILYFILLVVNAFADEWYLQVIMWFVLFWALFRMMSRNHIARARENAVFKKIIRPFKAFFTTNFLRIKDIGKKRYRTCKKCKAVIRLPIKRGAHTVTCPKCSSKFKVRIII